MLKIATSAQTRTAHYTLSSHPLHRTHRYTLSDPSQLLRGGKGQRSRVRTLELTPEHMGYFALKKRRIRVFGNDMHTCISSMQAIQLLRVCVDGYERMSCVSVECVKIV